MSQTTIPSMMPNAPTPATEPLFVVRLKMKLRATLDANRRLQRELMAARQEVNAMPIKLRKLAS